MEQPPNAHFNLDSFIRKRADQQRQQQKDPATAPPLEEPPTSPAPPPQPVSQPEPPAAETPESHTESTATSNTTPPTGAAAEVIQQQKTVEHTTEQLKLSTQSAKESQQSTQEAVSQLEIDAEGSQARLAAEAAQEAAQASLDAIEFAHQATRSAIQEATEGREQKQTYNTHRLLVILNITLLVAALATLTIFIWPTSQSSTPAPAAVDNKTTEHLTQQLLLDTQRERLRSEQELALMERSLARLIEEQRSLKVYLDETKNQLNSERARAQQNESLTATFSKMEQDLKQKITQLEVRLEQKEQPQIIVAAPVPTPVAQEPAISTPTTAVTQQPIAAPTTIEKESVSVEREKEVDEILQKLYSLHSELSEQKVGASGEEGDQPATTARPYSYNRR